MRENDLVELLPCPFCGGDAFLRSGEWGQGYPTHEVVCSECSCELFDKTKTEAIAAWNTRAPDPRITQLEADNAALREALSKVDGQAVHGLHGDWCLSLKAIRNTVRKALGDNT